MLRVLHVASFNGNIGDNANHHGFRPWFEGLVGQTVEWVQWEIREVYRGQRSFDLAFAAEANRHDLLVVGGGNYFELWVDHSPTGTSFSISDEAFAALEVPIFFNALGVDAAQGVSSIARDAFTRFLSRVLTADHCLVSVRNDGSADTLAHVTRGLLLEKVFKLPDAGFFANYPPKSAGEGDGPVIGVNLAGDMLDSRFPGAGSHTPSSFISAFAGCMVRVKQKWPLTRFVLFPHIFRDLAVFADLLASLPDEIRREAVRVEAFDSGDGAAAALFGAYHACDLILGMRFHANVVPIGLGVSVIGLSCYEQIRLLYDELGHPELALDVRDLAFASRLDALIENVLSDPVAARGLNRRLFARAEACRRAGEERITEWLASQGLVGLAQP